MRSNVHFAAPRQRRALRTDPAEVQEEVRKSLRRYFRKKLERHPVVLPYIIET